MALYLDLLIIFVDRFIYFHRKSVFIQFDYQTLIQFGKRENISYLKKEIEFKICLCSFI